MNSEKEKRRDRDKSPGPYDIRKAALPPLRRIFSLLMPLHVAATLSLRRLHFATY